MQSGTTEKNSIKTSLTKLTVCSKKFVSENSIEADGGHFVNENGEKLCSLAYMRVNEILGGCILQKTECFGLKNG